ncbi:hypothetical protein RZ024_00170 [Citrobacter freundii]|uniref:Uncharacterized protein n=1 Tax=Citrobacter freundii TaxID=546 RepID=A0AAP5XWE0_CITFR|nr:hypothetical protein [Citrobacter freundii]ELT3492676.1 hypothetical protein [Citrobacter freundii]MCW0941839.1 hypothetical protein [Citrobacter freundii]MDV2189973.1 hypothetical protein [Citrobacter freundii]MDW2760220.1 hypothetical protein [Citrobacter freundii]MEB0532252.1 hypothetical protein [Citrobacter freundii]
MVNGKEYRLPLGNVNPDDLCALSELIVSNSDKFENYALSSISDADSRYTYDAYNFEIVDIDECEFRFNAPYSYYEGCADKNYTGQTEGYAAYEIIDNEIVFTLDELSWDVR